MSLAATIKKLEAANLALIEQAAENETALKEKIEANQALEQAHASMVTDHEAALAEVNTALETAKTELTDQVKALEEKDALAAEVAAELELAKKQLADPAHQAAGSEGESSATQTSLGEGGEPEPVKSYIAEYDALTDPADRAAYRADHMADMQAEHNAKKQEDK